VRVRGVALILAALAPACTDIPIGDGPRKAVIRRVATEVVLPAHAELVARTQELRDATAALIAAPDPARLAAAQQAWRAARGPWMESLAFRVGPVKDDFYQARLDQWPVDPARIAAEINGSAELTPDYIGGLGANKIGFHAAEVLLFDAAAGDPAVLAALGDGPAAARRRAYLAAVTELLARDAAALYAAWDPARGGFAGRIVDIGGDGPFATVKEASDALVNESIFLAELVVDTKLGKPLGKPSGGDPVVDLVQSAPSDGGIDDMLGNVRGLRAVYLGSRGPQGAADAAGGLGTLVAATSPAIDARVRAELDAAEAALSAVPRPFAGAVASRAAAVEAAWRATHELRLTLATEMVSALGATLSFNDNDGD